MEKDLANELDKTLFCFPTVASNCAAVTAISVIYHPDIIISTGLVSNMVSSAPDYY